MNAQVERPPVANSDGVEVRPVLETLSRLRNGAGVLDALALELNKVVNAVKDHPDGNKGGSVSLTLKVSRVAKLPNAVQVAAVVSSKTPEQPAPVDLFFFDEDGNLHTRNPRQRDAFEDGPQSVR